MAEFKPDTTIGVQFPHVIKQVGDYTAIYKPAGMAVHASDLVGDTPTLTQWLQDNDLANLRPVHRLDVPTCGIVLCANSEESARIISQQWANSSKHYVALVRGWMPPVSAIAPLRELRAVSGKGLRPIGEYQAAATTFDPIDTFEVPVAIDRYPSSRYSLVKVTIHSGRTHQIRRHAKGLSHPVIGDVNYGKGIHNQWFRANAQLDSLFLCATTLSFDLGGEPYRFSIELPDQLAATIRDLAALSVAK